MASVNFSPDGQSRASGSSNKTVRIWKIEGILNAPEVDAQPIRTIWRARTVADMAFPPDGKVLAIADFPTPEDSEDSSLSLWNVGKTLTLFGALPGNPGDVGVITFSPDGKILATGSRSGTVSLWDVNDGSMLTVSGTRTDWEYCLLTRRQDLGVNPTRHHTAEAAI